MTKTINTCSNCIHFNGEECTYGRFEGSERYSDSPACDDFEDDDQDDSWFFSDASGMVGDN